MKLFSKTEHDHTQIKIHTCPHTGIPMPPKLHPKKHTGGTYIACAHANIPTHPARYQAKKTSAV